MFKRVTWFGVGLLVGAAASKWVEVKARRRLARYFPARRLTLRTSPEATEVADWARGLAAGKVAESPGCRRRRPFGHGHQGSRTAPAAPAGGAGRRPQSRLAARRRRAQSFCRSKAYIVREFAGHGRLGCQ